MDIRLAARGILPTPKSAAAAFFDYATIFLRIQVDWLVALGIVNLDDEDDRSEPAEDLPADQ